VLNSGMIFLVGKHQFLVCSIDESQRENDLDEVKPIHKNIDIVIVLFSKAK
jgi:hypothetical protein